MTDFGMPTLIELKTNEQGAELCSKLRLKFIELNMSFPQNQPEAMDLKELSELKDKYGIYYTVHIDEALDPCSVNPGIAQVYTNTMVKTVEIAKKLDIPVLNMHLLRGIYVTLPERRTYVYAENEGIYLERMKSFRDRVTEAIGEAPIKVCIENTDDGGYLPFQIKALDLLLESPCFALTYDVGHDYAVNNIDGPVILSRGDRLMHMHLHDADSSGVHKALGDGQVELCQYLNLAKKHDCRVLVETKTVEALKKSALWLKNKGYLW